ncbi:MAG: hypothetical protein ACUVTG_12115 [Candidatus Oleimicrobiaceae bacterium]
MQPSDSAPGHYISARLVDLTLAEEAYGAYPAARPRLLLRERWQRDWNGAEVRSFNMLHSPVRYDPSAVPVIKLAFLAPCQARYAVRRLDLPLSLFNMYRMISATLQVRDPDNPDCQPWGVTGEGS